MLLFDVMETFDAKYIGNSKIIREANKLLRGFGWCSSSQLAEFKKQKVGEVTRQRGKINVSNVFRCL